MDQDCLKSVFSVQKKGKKKHYYRILHNRINLGTRFIIIIEFSISELVQVTIFIFNKQFYLLDQIYPKVSISAQK